MQFSTLMMTSLAAGMASAICPGFKYGIGFQQDLGGGVSRWQVYDGDCRPVDSLTTTGNPCDQGTFGCTSDPITFNRYTNNFNGLVYVCRPDPNSGMCGDSGISVCRRNDGN